MHASSAPVVSQLFIPPLGTVLELAEDWEFDLWGEYRNAKMLMQMGLLPPTSSRWSSGYDKFRQSPARVTLMAGTHLRIERIYIRQGSSGFDSITFTVVNTPDKRFLSKRGTVSKVRFWAKLADANRIRIGAINP